MRLLVTGSAGFIGSALCRRAARIKGWHVVAIDKLTYASREDSLAEVITEGHLVLVKADVCDRQTVDSVFTKYQPEAVIHLAAESHVDRSIDDASPFCQANVIGTASMLEATRKYWANLPPHKREQFRFHQVSTDEVYGDVRSPAKATEADNYNPRSPYAATKASADLLVRAWSNTYGLPISVSASSNNYGPFQNPEKFIPLAILNALHGRAIPIYGDGRQIRDWLYVEDHVDALLAVLCSGRAGETYNVGTGFERTNLDVATEVCRILDNMARQPFAHRDLIQFVADRPGHDRRYSISSQKIKDELGWAPKHEFSDAIERTVRWYVENRKWWEPLWKSGHGRVRLGIGRSGHNN